MLCPLVALCRGTGTAPPPVAWVQRDAGSALAAFSIPSGVFTTKW